MAISTLLMASGVGMLFLGFAITSGWTMLAGGGAIIVGILIALIQAIIDVARNR
jgi:hypothetical protein